VDHESYDTTSILATIERRYGLRPLSPRDAAANDLRHAFGSSAKGR
jgi:phospholipase C